MDLKNNNMVKLEETNDRRRLHIGSYFVDLNETDYRELIRIFSHKEGAENDSSTLVLCNSILPNYEYEIFFNSEPDEPVQIHGWYPIATDKIQHPEKIEHYIKKGLLRRIIGKVVE